MKIKNYKSVRIQGLTETELTNIQSLAEGILDGIATIRAGIDVAKGYVLAIDEDNNVTVVRELSIDVGA